jgi:hypothetical protein
MSGPFQFPLAQFVCTCGAIEASFAADIPDHADAFAELLEEAADKVRSGEAVPEVAGALILPVRVAARRV